MGLTYGGLFSASLMFYHRGHGEKKEHTEKAMQLFYGERRFRRGAQMYADMENGYAFR